MALDDKPKTTVGEFFAANPDEADRRFFGRVSHPDRRGSRP